MRPQASPADPPPGPGERPPFNAPPASEPSADPNGVAAESYREVVDSLSEVLFRTDELGRLVFLNDAWKDLSGFELESARLHPLTDFLHPDDRLRARDAIRALLAGDGQEWSDELRLRTLAGEIRWVGIACRTLRDGSGQESGIAGTIDDISARKIAEFSLRNLNQELESRVRSRTAELEDRDARAGGLLLLGIARPARAAARDRRLRAHPRRGGRAAPGRAPPRPARAHPRRRRAHGDPDRCADRPRQRLPAAPAQAAGRSCRASPKR